MKNIVKQASWILPLLALMIGACTPQELDDHGLSSPAPITDEQVSFTRTVSPTSDNMITFTSTTPLPEGEVYTIRWDLGNGASGNRATVVGLYPFSGDYTVTLSIYSAHGLVARRSEALSFPDDDFSLIDTPAYRSLTGGAENDEGKTWVFDQYNNGHFGVGEYATMSTPEWWSAGAGAKEGSSLYTQKFTFIQSGTKVIWENNGYIYTNEAGKNGLGNPAGVISDPGGVGDFDVPYVPNAEGYTFILDEENMTLTLSDGAFFGHYTGSSEYDILTLTETEMYIKVASTVESGNGWWYRLIPIELNVEAPAPPKELKAVPLAEGFEKEEFLNFVQEDMGSVSRVVDNPLPLPINTSDKVFRYWKSTGFYSNLSFTAEDYKFDLTTQNKIRMKVYIPSYNNYTTENDVAGEWIANKKLLPQLAVKLQDSEHPEPWLGQTEIIHADLEMNKWLELEFDFSDVSNREDYDRIVIQFGAEGHAGSGFFFFDDFEFDE